MEFLVACGASIVAKLVEYTTVLSGRLLFDYRRNVDNLRARFQELNHAEKTIRGRVKEATRIGEEIHVEVQSWLSSTRSISQRAEDFLNNNRDQANFSCCNVRIPNLASRRQLSREARQMVEDVTRQIQAAEIDRISFRPALHSCIAFRGDYEYFESRKRMLEDIMKALKDREVTKIGVYGMGGIGKTMLAKEVARQVTDAKLFAEVTLTTISQTPDPRRLQQEIAEKINLNIKDVESIPARADRLQRRLREEKSILIILDDIWEILDLQEVGIRSEHDGCKILMTSRSLDVVRSMGVEKTVEVSSISGEEATNLFQRIVGDIVERPDFKGLAIDVVRECGRLPLAITTVASTLKGQDSLDVWRDTLGRLRSIISPTNIDEPLREVYRSIRLSYDSLSDEQKSLLLLCSLHGEDRNIRIQNLIMIGVGWGLFQNVHTLSDARTRVYSLVVRLKARCLLLDGYVCDVVRMHDVIRDVALSIASEERGMHSIVIDKLEDCLNGKNLKDSKVISLLRYESSDTQLPEGLDCPHLESLFFVSDAFGRMERRVPIPKHFFEKSKHHLKSLLFCGAELVPIPPSLHSLQNLQTLCLRGCVLEDVKLIGDLKSLIILDLSHSTIKQLPIEVGQLNRLQLLNLEGCEHLELIEPNVISSLIRLEELRIPDTFDKWEVGEITVSRRSNANLAELMNLPQLTSLSLKVSHSKTFPKHFMFRKELEQYRIFIGGSELFDRDSSQLSGITRSLQLKLEERSQLKELGLESLVKRSEALSLDGLAGVKNVVCDLDNEGFSYLKRLEFIRNVSVQYIVNCTADQQIHLRKAFPMLETLRLRELTNLERICQGKLPQDSFNKLRKVYVTNCDKLKNLFPLSIAKRLKSIEVSGCDMMEEVVGHGTENDAHIIHVVKFLKLRWLTLKSLPRFVQFINWSESEATCGSPSVQSPIPLFCEKLEFPSLEKLILSGINVQILWVDFQLRTTSYMDNLTRLDVSACNNLKYLFPFFIAERLVKLWALGVSDCDVMEDIVVIKNLEEEGRLGKILFPKLRHLELDNLPALRNFCVGDCIKFESLSMLRIHHCPQLKTFYTCSTPILEVLVDNEEGNHSAIIQPFFNEKVIMPVLKYLETDWSNAMNEQLNMSQSSSTVLVLPLSNQLKELKLNCSTRDKPIALLIFDLLRRYQNLEKLTLKGFFVTSAQEYDGQPVANLTMLKLDNVPKLRYLFGESENAQPTNLLACFQNLTILKVSFCHRLTYLLASTIATSLVQLQEMRVTDCNRMTTIIEDYRENETTKREHDHEFVFLKLKILELRNLPHLESFYSGNTDIRLPMLEELFVTRCPEMRTFSSGNVSTPMLHTIIEKEIEDEWRSESVRRERWDGDVNTTVRKLCEEDSNLALQQLFTETEVHDSREGTSSRAATL